MTVSNATLYDQCHLDTWTTKIAPDINPVPADESEDLHCRWRHNRKATCPSLNVSTKEFGGGLISNNYLLVPTTFTPHFQVWT